MVPRFPLGVYVHFPWCRRRCPYCDFAVEVAREPPHQEYLAAVLAELAELAPRFEGRELSSIYFGGGTPSLWQPGCLAHVVAAVKEHWPAPAPLEITLEANPTDCTPERIAQWKAAGITRVSVGVQELRSDVLEVLGRDHRMGDGPAALAHLAAAGELEVSADFIAGVPRRGRLGAAAPGPELAWIEALVASAARHASVYELTVEPGAAFAKRVADGRLVARPAEEQAELYVAIDRELSARGFEHYEISSYARPGARAVHNSLYWSGGEYLGLGVGAASYWRGPGGAERWSNRRRFAQYRLERLAERHAVSEREDAADRLWLGLRTKDGVTAEALAAAPGVTEWLLAQGLAERAGARVCPTLRGFLFADAIAQRIVEATAA